MNKRLDNIIKIFHSNKKIKVKFPEVREVFKNIKIITSFSHANINLPIDEINGNDFLNKLTEKLNLEKDEILNILYDNAIPFHDNPKGCRIQYGVVNPKFMKSKVPYAFQKEMKYNEQDILKNNQNVLYSIPDENQKIFQKRIETVNKIFSKEVNNQKLNIPDRITNIRKKFFELIDITQIHEVPFSKKPTGLVVKVLEILAKRGYPFWTINIPEKFRKYKSITCFMEGINEEGYRVPVKCENNHFKFQYNKFNKKIIHKYDIFNALKNRVIIPTMPFVILTLMVAPQIIHIGGGVWLNYCVEIAETIKKWLKIDIDITNYALSTGGLFSPYVYKKSQYYYGFPLIYSTFGKRILQDNINNSEILKVELQRRVFI